MWGMVELDIGRPIRGLGTGAHQTQEVLNSMGLMVYYTVAQQPIPGQLLTHPTLILTLYKQVEEELAILHPLLQRILLSNETHGGIPK